MNSAVVVFLDSVETAEVVAENGVEVGELFLPAHALSSPAVKVIVSNVPPFIRNDDIIRELAKHGKVVSPVRRMSSGFKSPLLKHVVSHRRQVLMIPSNRSREVNLVFKITVEDFDYVVFAKTDDFKCYSCGKEGHMSRDCSEKNGSHGDQNQNGTGEDRGDKQDGQEGTSGAQEARVEVTTVAQEVRVEVTTVAQEARVEVTSGLQEVRESTEGQVELGSEVDMEEDEAQLRVPHLKRKGENGGVSQAKKVATTASIGAAGCEPGLEKDAESGLETDSESSLETDSESSLGKDAAADIELSEDEAGSCKDSESYSVEEIQEFLRKSKNVRGAKVEDYLSDKEKLSSSARSHMRSKGRGGLTKQEGFRLKKIVQTIRTEMNETGAHVLTPAVSRTAGGRSQDGHPGRHDSRLSSMRPSEDSRLSSMRPSEDSGLSGMRRPSEDSGLSGMRRPSEDSGLSGMLRPSEDSGLSGMMRPSEDSTGGAGGS